MSDQSQQNPQPQAETPPRDPFTPGEEYLLLNQSPLSADPVLNQLGTSPFTRTTFPILGLLESVYEHITEHAKKRFEEDEKKAAS